MVRYFFQYATVVFVFLCLGIQMGVCALTPAQKEEIKKLNSRYTSDRINALSALAGVTDASVLIPVRYLAERENNIGILAGCAAVLVYDKDPKSGEIIEWFLTKHKVNVRKKVVEALINEGIVSLGYVYMALGDEDPSIRTMAVKHIAAVCDYRFAPSLDGVMLDSSNFVRIETIKAMAALVERDPGEEGSLTGKLTYQLLLKYRIPLSEEDLSREKPEIQSHINDVLRKAIRDKSSLVRSQAIESLAELKARGLLDLLRRNISDTARDVRQTVMTVLRETYPQKAAEVIGSLVDHSNIQVRIDAIDGLAKVPGVEVESITPFLTDQSSKVRLKALSILADRGGMDAFSKIAGLAKDSDENVRLAVARYLGTSNNMKLAQNLAELLNDSSPSVRKEAVMGLSQMKGSSIVTLLERAADDSDVSVRNAYIDAISVIGGSEGSRQLVAQLTKEDIGVGEKIAAQLKKVGPLAVKPICDALPELSKNFWSTQIAVTMLGDLKATESVPFLISLLKSNHLASRNLAMEALVKINDPRALGPLSDYFVDNQELSPEAELTLKSGLKALGVRSFLFLQIRRHLYKMIVVLVLIGIIIAAWTSGAKLQSAEAERLRKIRQQDLLGAVKPKEPELPETIEALKKRIERDVQIPDKEGNALYLRGQVKFMEGDLDGCKRDLEEAARKCDETANSHIAFILGELFEKRQDETYAFRSYTQSLRLTDKEKLGKLMSTIAAESAEDIPRNIALIKAALPWHGEFTLERIIGKEPWITPQEETIPVATVVEDGDHSDAIPVAAVIEDEPNYADDPILSVFPAGAQSGAEESNDAFSQSTGGEAVSAANTGADDKEPPAEDTAGAEAHFGIKQTGQFIDDPDAVPRRKPVKDQPVKESVPVGGESGFDALDAFANMPAAPDPTESEEENNEDDGVFDAHFGIKNTGSFVTDDDGEGQTGDVVKTPPEQPEIARSSGNSKTSAGTVASSKLPEPSSSAGLTFEGPDDEDDSLKAIRYEADMLIEKAPEVAGMAFYRRAMLNLRAGMWPQALSDIDNAQRRSPVELHIHLHYLRGLIYEKKGRNVDALASYWKALRMYDSDLFQEAVVDTGELNTGDSVGNIAQITSRLPYHGEFTAARILGTKPWEDYTFTGV